MGSICGVLVVVQAPVWKAVDAGNNAQHALDECLACAWVQGEVVCSRSAAGEEKGGKEKSKDGKERG